MVSNHISRVYSVIRFSVKFDDSALATVGDLRKQDSPRFQHPEPFCPVGDVATFMAFHCDSKSC